MIRETSGKMSMIYCNLKVILKNQLKRMTLMNLKREKLQR